MKILKFVLPLCGLLLLGGCGKSGQQDSGSTETGSAAAEPAGQVMVAKIDSTGLERLLKERQGKILLLNVWATWCIPCREEFPDLVKLAKNFRNQPVEVVGLSADYPDETESKIIPFLKEQNINFKVVVQDFERQEDLINRLNKDWSGALPATFIYDTTGKQIGFLNGKQTYEEFVSAVRSVQAGS